MMARKKKRAIIRVTEIRAKPPTYTSHWSVVVEWPFQVQGRKVFSTIGSYRMRLHADNLAERLDAELVDAEMK